MRQSKFAAGSRGSVRWASILRLTLALVAVWWISQLITQPAFLSPLLAQEDTNPKVGAESFDSSAASASRSSKAVIKHRTFIDSIKAGGYIGVIIILMSVVAVAFVIEHALTIRKERLMPEAAMDRLEELIERDDIQAAVHFCEETS